MTSIEEIYTELAHRKTFSPAEAEFRAYLIYLNLNDTIKGIFNLFKFINAAPVLLAISADNKFSG